MQVCKLLAREKAAGGTRASVTTPAFRRVALESLAQFADCARQAAGEEQYARAVKGGMDKMFFGIMAQLEARRGMRRDLRLKRL